MKLSPVTEYEEIDREAAKHLYRLLQRYNWSLEDPARYRDRWAAFWPSITIVERKALALLVMANGGNLGTRFEIRNLPAYLRAYQGQSDRVVLHRKVEEELKGIVGRFYASLTNPAELGAFLQAECRLEYEAVMPFGGATMAFDNGRLIPSEFSDRCFAALRQTTVDEETARRYTDRLFSAINDFLVMKEMAVWE